MATGAVIAGILGVGATTAAVIAAGINMAISFAASYLLAKQATSGGSMSASDYKQTIQQDKVAQRVMYGRRQVSIVMNFAEEQDGVQEISDKDGESHELLYLSGMFCNHPVNSFSDVYLDDKSLSDYGDNATVHHINGTGIIPQDWMDETTQYESTMTGSKGYWAAMKLRHDSTVFSGIPTLKVTVEGKRVKDFRTGQMVYTNNAALVIADFYINYMNIPESRLLMSGTGSFIDAANLCDENMPDGNKRYEINGMFELDAKPSDILNEMLKSCGGTLIRMNGVIGLLPAAYYGDVDPFVISESDIVGGISMSPQESLSDCVNIMSGTYVEEEDDWSEQDFPPIRDEAAIVRDGFEVSDDVDYAFVTNALQAQRLVNIELRRRTAGGFTELTMSPKGAYCRVGRVVEMNLPQLNLSGEFRITSQVENSDLTFTITMQRDDIEIYDDAIGEPYSPPPLLDLGGGTLASPSGLQFVYSYNDAVGNVIQGVLTWQNNSASTSYFNVVITNDDGDIVQTGDAKGYVFNVNALPIGNYLGKVRAVDSRGRTSSYATTSFSVGEPKVPASFRDISAPDDGQVHSLYARSNWNIAITPNIIGGTPQGTEFEFWHLADSGSYISGHPEYDEGSINLATLVATASSLNNGGLIPDRWQHYWVRSVNPYGKSDFIYLQTGTAKEQDLVTTVVERLKAIEVESQNWLADPDTNWSEYGYKLFSAATGVVTMPDGTVLENPDGLAVFQNIIANGHITAKTLTFVDADSIPPEIDNKNVKVEQVIAIPNASSYTNQSESSSNGEIYIHGKGGDKDFTITFEGGSLTIDPNQVNNSIAESYMIGCRKDGSDAFDSTRKFVAITGNVSDGFLAKYYLDGAQAKSITDPEDWVVFGWATNSSAEFVESVTVQSNAVELLNATATPVYNDNWIYPDQSSIQIKSSNYSSGSSGWAIDKYGNSEFNNIVARGDGYFNNGWFKGTVYADKISGDVVSALVLSASSKTAGAGWTTFDSVKVNGSSSKTRRLVVTVALKASSSRSGTGNSGAVQAKGRVRLAGSFGTVYSQYLETPTDYHSDQDGGTTSVINQTEVTLIVTVPANTTGTATVQVDAEYGSIVVSGTSGNLWIAQLMPNGSDLGS
ncbi:tail fiber protein [Vibrio phage 1205]